ncbi:hypothetical protein CPB83DRAFT_416238 [Crepidotus variabilis]|uniref:Death domain-containing protein n=1 Tax=Crepidotus variabilis TaxID=179855 RepID=A0A9P6ERQ0_9AGAR|nr:hypothetical protein CPB83DRAFT_416238 [Crepidotus variabilis]
MIQSSSSEISNTPIIFESLQPQIHLPRELLEVIFGFYLPQTLSDEYTSPTRLCLVCPAWHAIVLSWSPFWTVLKLRGKLLRSIVTDFPADDTKMLLATWLGRSRGLAISLVLEVVELNDEEGVKEVLRMESVRMRLTSLRIAVNQLRYPRVKDPVHFPPDYKLTEFPLLQTLGFSVAYPSLGIRWYGRRPLSISTLPQLLRGLLLANHNIQNLDSQGLAFHLLLSDNASITETRWSFLPITPFQWGIDLTKIKIDTLQSTSHCLAILQYCNRLRICQLGCLVWANDEPTDSFPAGIVARHLQQLSLKGNIHAEFFTSLSAPILESLTISHTHTVFSNARRVHSKN